MFELDSFLYHIINDTNNSVLQWNSIRDSWADEYCALDFRSVNLSLNCWVEKNPFIYNSWGDIYIAEIMTGYVYVAKHMSTPPYYSLHLQPDAHSKIFRLNSDSKKIKELYDAIQHQIETSYDEVADFIYAFNMFHVTDRYDDDDMNT